MAESSARSGAQAAEEGVVRLVFDDALEVEGGFAEVVVAPHAGFAAGHLLAGGDVVVFEVVPLRFRRRMGVFKGIARVNNQIVVEGTMTFALGPTVESAALTQPPESV